MTTISRSPVSELNGISSKPIPMPAFEHFRTATRQHVENHDEYFDRFRREYFMVDLFPENDRRFPVTLKECLREDPEESR